MKYYNTLDYFIRQRIRNNQLTLFYAILFLALWILLSVTMVYLNIFYLQLGVNVYLPLYAAVYITMLLWMRVQYRRLPSTIDAVVLRRMLRNHAVVSMLMACLILPIHMVVVEGYALRAADIPLRILLIEWISYALFAGLSLAQCLVVYRSDKWPAAVVPADMESGGG